MNCIIAQLPLIKEIGFFLFPLTHFSISLAFQVAHELQVITLHKTKAQLCTCTLYTALVLHLYRMENGGENVILTRKKLPQRSSRIPNDALLSRSMLSVL